MVLLAGIDLPTGQVHALVKVRHRIREFVEFLRLLDAAYPTGTAIHLILDNHSAHISKETRAWLAAQPDGCFQFTFTPKDGSWLNLVEGFFQARVLGPAPYPCCFQTGLPDHSARVGIETSRASIDSLGRRVMKWHNWPTAIARRQMSLLPCGLTVSTTLVGSRASCTEPPNTRCLDRTITALRTVEQVADRLLAYLSPLGWDHVKLTGGYVLGRRRRDERKP
jgi:hypothetical protein